MAKRKDGSIQGVVTYEVLRNNAGHLDRGLGMTQGVESANNPKDDARRKN